MVFLFIILLPLLFYSLLMAWCSRQWMRLPEENLIHANPLPPVSVIIPARNEAAVIGKLLQSLHSQTCRPLEIIVVDDDSDDQTAGVAASFENVQVVRLTGADSRDKKKALTAGIAAAKGEWIVTTDADCIVPPGWLEQLLAKAEKNQALMVAGPVTMPEGHTLLSVFQSLDFLVLQGVTGALAATGSPALCNGASLAFEKKAFETVGGYQGIDRLASGDDMLLLQKFNRRFPGKVSWLKSKAAIVKTRTESAWSDFWQQRIRWASKARLYTDRRLWLMMILVFVVNLSLVALLLAGLFQPLFFLAWLLLIAVKTLVEWPFVSRAAAFFGRSRLMPWFPFLQPLHILYTVLAASFGLAGGYRWKGRKLK